MYVILHDAVGLLGVWGICIKHIHTFVSAIWLTPENCKLQFHGHHS